MSAQGKILIFELLPNNPAVIMNTHVVTLTDT